MLDWDKHQHRTFLSGHKSTQVFSPRKQEEWKELIPSLECSFPFPPQVAQFGPSATRRYEDLFPIMAQALALVVMRWENWLQPRGDWRRWAERQFPLGNTHASWCHTCGVSQAAVWRHRRKARPEICADLLHRAEEGVSAGGYSTSCVSFNCSKLKYCN